MTRFRSFIVLMLALAALARPAGAQTPPPAALAAPPAPPPDRLAVGDKGFWRPGILLQAWFFQQAVPGMEGEGAYSSDFRVRRAELHLKGEIIPRLGYAVMIDPAKVLEPNRVSVNEEGGGTVEVPEYDTRFSVFQDFFITWQSGWADVSVGQFKIPVSWEGYNSSSKLLFPERARVSNAFGDKRDLGVRVAKTFGWFGYSAGVFNGRDLNRRDTDDGKDLALRLEAYPIDGLTVAGVGYASVGDRDQSVKDRLEADVRLERGPALLQGEVIYARDRDGGPLTEAYGYYAAAAYTLMGKLQPALRFGRLDSDIDQDLAGGDDELYQLDAGLNYYLHSHQAKVQASYSLFLFDDLDNVHQVILASQVSF